MIRRESTDAKTSVVTKSDRKKPKTSANAAACSPGEEDSATFAEAPHTTHVIPAPPGRVAIVTRGRERGRCAIWVAIIKVYRCTEDQPRPQFYAELLVEDPDEPWVLISLDDLVESGWQVTLCWDSKISE